MRVGIDISSVIYDRGVSRYTTNLVKALLNYTDLELVLYGSSLRQKKRLERLAQEMKLAKPETQQVIQAYPPKMLALLWKLGRNNLRSNLPQIDIFHSWDWLQPPDKKLPLISTIHDLAILKYPETAHPQILKMHQQSWKILKERQADIIAVSQATKKDIVKLLKIPEKRVHVVYEALPQETIQTAELLEESRYEKLKQGLKLDKPYLLFVGTREPRKNLDRLIKAWQPFSKEYDLIIAGAAGWDKTGKRNKEVSLHDKPRFLVKVSDAQLSVLYSAA